jgi:predicted RNA-binding protein YlxR (DUF448 family)
MRQLAPPPSAAAASVGNHGRAAVSVAPFFRMCIGCRKLAPTETLVRMQIARTESSSALNVAAGGQSVVHVCGGPRRRRPTTGRSTYVHALESCLKRFLVRPVALDGRGVFGRNRVARANARRTGASPVQAASPSRASGQEVAIALQEFFAHEASAQATTLCQSAHLSWVREGQRALDAARQSVRVNKNKGAK